MQKRIGRLPFLTAVLAGTISASAVAAPPTDLFISEYVEGSSFNKAIEIYNGTGAPIDLAAGTYDVQKFSNGSATVSSTIALSGTIADGDVFVLAHNSAVLGMTPDATSGSLDVNGDDALVLRHNGAIIDVIGRVGEDPASGEWGTGDTSTANNTIQRMDTVCAGDTDETDAFDPSLEWNGFPQDTFSGLGSHTANCGAAMPNLSIDDVSQLEGNSGTTTFSFTVSIDAVSASDVTFDYATVDGTATAADGDYVAIATTGGTITAGNLATTIDVAVGGDTIGEGDENFTVELSNVVGAVVADGSGLGTITNDDASVPDLSIDDVSAVEGDSGTQTFTFNVTLSAPAPAGGVSFTYNTVDGSATAADSDYVAIASTPGAIAAGLSSTTIDVTVNGDTNAEPDEQFSVSIGSASNAGIADGVGIGTIQNDDCTPISAVQGAGAFSPFVPGASLSAGVNGSGVDLCEAIVTAVTYDTSNAQLGFFIQSMPADDDGNPATSEGLYVFTSFTSVAVGDRVQVSGTVREHYAMTEMVHDAGVQALTVNIIDNGNPLPTPVEFSSTSGLPSTDPSALSCPGSGPDGLDPLNTDTNFECFEGMLVTVPEAVALNGNFRRGNDTYAELQFSPRAERSLREPGLVFPQAAGTGNASAPEWDGNPEIMEMDPDIARRGSGGLTPGIDTQIVGGARFSATGPLTFDFGDYVLWPTELIIDNASNLLPRPVEAPLAATELSVGSFNMQHLCDDNTTDGCNRDSPRYPGLFGLPVWDYATKNARVAAYVCDVLLAPDVLGAQEVDSQTTLADLATAIFDYCGVTYSAALIDGNDPGGIDVGFLTRDDRVTVDSVTQFFLPNQWPDPGCSPAPCTDDLHDRPPLLLRGQFTSAPGAAPFEFAVLNNHTKARSNVDDSGAAAERDRAKRFWQAREIAQLVQDFQTASGDFAGLGTDSVPLVLVGDYNAYQFTDGRVDVVGLIAGTYDDDANECNAILQDGSATVETCNIGTNIVSPALQNLVLSVPPGEEYSFLFIEDLGQVQGYGTSGLDRDVVSGNVLDHVLASATALPYVSGIGFGRANHDVSVQSIDDDLAPDGAGGTQSSLALRSSDHDGLVAYFDTNCANLTITPGSEPDPDEDGVCTFADNCPAIANNDQTDANGNGLGAACDATPVAVNDPAAGNYAATEDTMLSVPAAGLLANDTDTDGDSLSASLVDASSANGSVTVNLDGSFSYTPSLDFCDDLNPVTFTYAASDGETTSSAATASLLVACVNDAPLISDIASPQMTTEETAVMVAFTINDVDSTLDCSAANLTATSSNTTLMPVAAIVFAGTAPNCSATLTPASNETGNSTIRITVSDGALESFDEFVLSVSNVDDPALLSDDSASVNEDAPATAIDVLANDLDPDSALQISGLTQPANGTVVLDGGGTSLTYQPDADYCNDGVSTDDFTYDANGQTATVHVTVVCQNDDALAAGDSTSVTQNSVGNVIDVLANDTADPNFALSIDSVDVSSAQGGSVSINGSQIRYTPAAGFCGGTDTFDYSLVGGSSATVTVTVDCLAPSIFADGFED